MAEDKIRHEDIIESDIFRDATQSAERFDAQLNQLIDTFTRVGSEASKSLVGNPSTLKQMKDEIKALDQVQKAYVAYEFTLKKAEVARQILLEKEQRIAALKEKNAATILTAEQKVQDAINKTATTQQLSANKIALSEQKIQEAKNKTANAQQIADAKILQSEQKVQQEKIKTEQAELKLAEAKRKVEDRAKKEAEANKRASEAYAKLSAQHRELVREAKNLAVAYGSESKEAKAAAAAANQLDKQLKTIDASLGQHQRNVGNYASAWGGVVTGFKNLLGGLGIGIGVAAVKDFFVDSIKSFADAEKNANALAFALNNVGGEGEAAFIKLQEQSAKLQASGGIFSDDEITKAQTQLVNYGLLSDEVEKLMPKILDLATVQGVDLATATDTVIKGINGQTKGLKTVGLGFEDTGSKAENYNIILDKLTKFEGAAAEAATTTEGRYKVLMNRFDDLKESIGEYLINEGYQFLQHWDLITGEIDAATFAMNKFKKTASDAWEPIVDNALSAVNAIDGSTNKLLFINQKILDAQLTINRYQGELAKARLRGEDTSGLEGSIEGMQSQLDRLLKARSEILHPQNKKTLDQRLGMTGEAAKKDSDDWQKEWEAAIKSVNDEAEAAQADERRRAADRIKWQKHQHKLWLEDQKAKRQREEDAYRAKKLAEQKQREEEKRKRQEELDYLISLEEAFTDAYFKGVDRRLSAKEKALQDESTLIDDELQRQSERQLAGLDNTYSLMQQKKAENIAKQAELDEQRRKVEKAKEFSELFVEFTKAYAKDGSIDAAAKAFTQTIAVRAIADAISGSFATGVEDFKGKGTGTSDSNLIRFSAGESVVTAKGTQETAGLVTMVNKDGFKGAEKWAFENIFMPELSGALGSDAVIQSNTGDNLYQSAIINGLLQVKKAVEDKPESGLNYNQAERIFEEKIKRAGIVTVKRHKRF